MIKSLHSAVISISVALAFSAGSAHAQDSAKAAEPDISTPVSVPSAPPQPSDRKNFKERGVAPRDMGEWASAIQRNYPASALREGLEGTVRLTVTVDKTGKVASCTVTGSSGSAALDEAACIGMTTYARFWPARDKQGREIESEYVTAIRYQLPNGSSSSAPLSTIPRDFEIWGREMVPLLARGADNPGEEGFVKTLLTVDREGLVSDCAILQSSGSLALDQEACTIMQANALFEPATETESDFRYVAFPLTFMEAPRDPTPQEIERALP